MDTVLKESGYELTHHLQLATLLTFQACLGSGMTIGAVVSRYVETVKNPDERNSWANLKADLDAGTPFNLSLIQSGLFSASIERMFAVIDDSKVAIEAVIDYLKAVRD